MVSNNFHSFLGDFYDSAGRHSQYVQSPIDRTCIKLSWYIVWNTRRFFELLWKILRFVSDSFFFLYLFTCYLPFVNRCSKIIKDTKEKYPATLKLDSIYGVYNYLWVRNVFFFFWTNRDNRVSRSRHLRNIMKSFLANCEFEGPSLSWGCY